MAEMEKEGRPPENKRSRKPAHPVKREINEEMKSFAENTMNELLGWYGYDKVELRDSDNLEMGETPQHISVLKENSLPKMPASTESSEASPYRANATHSGPASRNGVPDPSTTPSTSAPSSTKEHGGTLPMMVPVIPPPPLIKPPSDEDASNVQIMCAWCQKVGVKRYSLSMGSELKSFCSEKCFAACRRAYFKRNKARDEDGLGVKLPHQHISFTQDPPRVVFKTNSDVLVCDWCKHIRHTKEYLDFGAGERRLQFCSAKCLNQYKMDIFYKETQAALPPGALCNPGHVVGGGGPGGEGQAEGCGGGGGGGVQLLTPESWGTPLTDPRRRAPSPGGPGAAPSTSSAAASPSDTVCSPSSSSSAKIPTPRPPHESPTLPPPPPPMPHHTLHHPPMGVPSGSPPMVMTPRGPMPLPLFMEHQMFQHMRPPYLRPSAHHAGGPNSPLSNPMIPGIGAPPPPPPPRNLGPPSSSPMHRPMMSPHVHPSANPNPGHLPPYPGFPMPGMPPFGMPPMMPNGPHMPMPPMMNFGMPSLAPLVPPPTLLVPYPVIVPLPIPIPIPIPIPFPYSPKASRDRPDSSSPISSAPSEPSASGPQSPGSSGGDAADQKVGPTVSPGFSERCGRTVLVDSTVKAEDGSGGGACLSGGPPGGPVDGVIDLTVGQRSCQEQQQFIHRMFPGVRVKEEAETEPSPPPLPLPGPPCIPAAMARLWGDSKDERGAFSQGLCSEGPDAGAANPITLETSRSSPGSNDSSSCSVEPPGGPRTDLPGQPSIASSTARTQPHPHPHPHPLTLPQHPQSLPKLQPSNAAPCNVIVNGTGWHTLLAPASAEHHPPADRRGDGGGAGGGGGEELQASNGELEREALKENSCSVTEWDPGKRGGAVGDEAAVTGEGKPGPDAGGLEEGVDQGYVLPLLPASGCVVIQPVPKAGGGDKTAILSCSISTPLSTAGSPELEPPLKRRCLRIRNQNK